MKRAPSLFLYDIITRNDAYKIASWLNNKKITKYLNEENNVVDSINALVTGVCPPLLTLHFNKFGRFFIINRDSSPIGYIKLVNRQNPNTYEIVIVIGEEKLWGMGIGGEAIKKSLDMVFFEWRAEKIIATIHNKNIRSKNLFTRSGFRQLAEKTNVSIYQVTFNDYICKANKRRS